jgi:hypothetical protein
MKPSLKTGSFQSNKTSTAGLPATPELCVRVRGVRMGLRVCSCARVRVRVRVRVCGLCVCGLCVRVRVVRVRVRMRALLHRHPVVPFAGVVLGDCGWLGVRPDYLPGRAPRWQEACAEGGWRRRKVW